MHASLTLGMCLNVKSMSGEVTLDPQQVSYLKEILNSKAMVSSHEWTSGA